MTPAWIVQASIVSAAILLAVHALRGRSSALREVLLLVALAKFAVPPSLLPFGSIFDVLATAFATPASAQSVVGGPSAQLLFWLATIYLAGVIAVLVSAIAGQRRLLRALRPASYADARLQARVVALASSLGSRGLISLLRSDQIAAPIAVGVFRRRIVVPSRLLASLSPHEIDAVLLHEIAHHRRGHIACGWARAAVCAVWWWNPLAWMVARGLRHTQEEVCDDLVIEHAAMDPDRYCDVLVRAASVASMPAGAAAFAQSLHPLGRRVKRLLDGAPSRAAAWKVWVTAILTACAVLPGAAARQTPSLPSLPAPSHVAELTSLPGLPEALAEVPTTVDEVRRDWTENIREFLYRDLRRAGAPDDVALDLSDTMKTRIARRDAVRNLQRSMVKALNPVKWFKSGGSSPSPSPSSSPSPSPSPSPSKDR